MDTHTAIQLLLDAHRLNRIPRSGWVMRGVSDAESVADHSFGVAFIALILSEMMNQPLDQAKLLTIALLHDLPESVIGDIPAPATVHFAAGAKREAETGALNTLLRGLSCAERWRSWWREFEDGETIEGRLVRDADRLDVLVQAYVYEQTTGNRRLEEFWERSEASDFEFAATRTLYEALRALRQRSV